MGSGSQRWAVYGGGGGGGGGVECAGRRSGARRQSGSLDSTCGELQQARLVLCCPTGARRQQRGEQRQPTGCCSRSTHSARLPGCVYGHGRRSGDFFEHMQTPCRPTQARFSCWLRSRHCRHEFCAAAPRPRPPCARALDGPAPQRAVNRAASMPAGLGAATVLSNGAQLAQPPHGPAAPLSQPTSSRMRRRALSSLRQIVATAAPPRSRCVRSLPAAPPPPPPLRRRRWFACLLASWCLHGAALGACVLVHHI